MVLIGDPLYRLFGNARRKTGYVAVKLIVLYFGFEVLTGELRKIALGKLAGLALLVVRGVV
jgi:hypothetical protein